ncbi:MAG: Dabb family protein [Clostridia bacterium]|nr:Dabb family protein [Clostridia bacterium]
MKHYIIAKFIEGTDVKALAEPVKKIFDETLKIPGVHSVDVKLSNSDRANRFDLMIIMDMDKEALPAYDASAPHHQWKNEYGERITKKAIFDCDE